MSDITRSVDDKRQDIIDVKKVTESYSDNNKSKIDDVISVMKGDGVINKDELNYLLNLYYEEKNRILGETKLAIKALTEDVRVTLLQSFINGNIFVENQGDLDFIEELITSLGGDYKFVGKENFKVGTKFQLRKDSNTYTLVNEKISSTPIVTTNVEVPKMTDDIGKRISKIISEDGPIPDLLRKNNLKSLLKDPGEEQLVTYLNSNSTILKSISMVLFSIDNKSAGDVITELKKGYYGGNVDTFTDGNNVKYRARESVGYFMNNSSQVSGLIPAKNNQTNYEFSPEIGMEYSVFQTMVDNFFTSNGITKQKNINV
ncbi:MAG: hypothetical protein PHO80_05745, partial [Candidatus Gracilibacteria bacterium]|nr:hypothetical protein [Candidatus Gracilibacteria bacterium]